MLAWAGLALSSQDPPLGGVGRDAQASHQLRSPSYWCRRQRHRGLSASIDAGYLGRLAGCLLGYNTMRYPLRLN